MQIHLRVFGDADEMLLVPVEIVGKETFYITSYTLSEALIKIEEKMLGSYGAKLYRDWYIEDRIVKATFLEMEKI